MWIITIINIGIYLVFSIEIHGGIVLSKVVNYFDHFNPEILYTLFGILLINIGLFIWFWVHNKKKYDNLKYQVPPEVLKSHLDAMMQNSSAMNSMMNQNDQNPSIVSAKDFTGGGANVSVGNSANANDTELINIKNSEINSLREELNQKTSQLGETTLKNDQLDLEIEQKTNYIKDLEARISNEPKDEDDARAQNEEMQSLIKDRDELKERLDEYAVIEDDLADLKRYKQENEELRKALADSGKEIPNLVAVPDAGESVDEIIDDGPEESGDEPDSLEALANALENDDSKTEETIASEEKASTEESATEEDLLGGAADILEEITDTKKDQESDSTPKEEVVAAKEENLEAATEEQAKEENTEVASETQSKDADDSSGEQVSEENKEAEEKVAAKNEVEEEKSLDDLLSEFEKMLG